MQKNVRAYNIYIYHIRVNFVPRVDRLLFRLAALAKMAKSSTVSAWLCELSNSLPKEKKRKQQAQSKAFHPFSGTDTSNCSLAKRHALPLSPRKGQ